MTISIIGFVVGFLGSMPLAGPIALLVFRKGMHHKYLEGGALALGAALAEALYCALAVFGFGHLFQRYPAVEPIAKLLGGVLMLGLGIMFMRSKPSHIPNASDIRHPQRKATPFFMGFSIAALNPTLILSWSGVTAILYAWLGAFTFLEQCLFPVTVGTGIFLWFMVMLMLMQRYQGRFRPERLNGVIRIFGICMAIAGIWMLASQLSSFVDLAL